MYATASPFSPPMAFSAGRAYRDVGLETGAAAATPHQLIAMLFDGLQESLAQARGALQSRNLEIKCRAIGRAVRIVEEGLKGGLNLETGGALAQDLRELYAYITLRLTRANLDNDEAPIAECQRLVEPIATAWAAIGDRAGR